MSSRRNEDYQDDGNVEFTPDAQPVQDSAGFSTSPTQNSYNRQPEYAVPPQFSYEPDYPVQYDDLNTVSFPGMSAQSSNPGSSNQVAYDGDDFYEQDGVPDSWHTEQYQDFTRPTSTGGPYQGDLYPDGQDAVPDYFDTEEYQDFTRPSPTGPVYQDPFGTFELSQYDQMDYMGAQDPTTVTNAASEQYQVPSSATESVSTDFATTSDADSSNSTSNTSGKVCSNCFTTETSQWYGERSNIATLCFTCYNYQRRHNTPRPQVTRKADLPKVCSNCSTTQSSKWRFDPSKTGLFCSGCYQFERRHTERPLVLRPKTAAPEKSCANCSTTRSYLWYDAPSGTGVLCRPCHMYQEKHQTARPARVNRPSPIAEMAKVCANCSTAQSSAWRYDHARARLLCEACHCYVRRHNKDRPKINKNKHENFPKICTHCSLTRSSNWYFNETKTALECYGCHIRRMKMKKQQQEQRSE